METREKQSLIEKSLLRAAQAAGDITPAVMARYYATHPDASDSFKQHNSRNTAHLEGVMVENTLYYLMNCLEHPFEIHTAMASSVPHHCLALDVYPEWYNGLIEATVDCIEETLPDDADDEKAVWAEVRGRLRKTFEECRADLADVEAPMGGAPSMEPPSAAS